MNQQVQTPLFHEDIFDAIRTVVMAMGGSKKVGAMFWPEKQANQAGELLNNCLNSTRPEKLDPEQLLFLIVHGQRIGCHAISDFIGQQAGYKLIPIEPDDEKAELQKQVVQASKDFGALVARLERLNNG
jgi:hypothetical protein